MSKTHAAGALALTLIAAAGCRDNPLAVSSLMPDGGLIAPVALTHPRSIDTQPAPPIRSVVARVRGATLEFTAVYDGRGHDAMPEFDPTRAGGWCFQLFLDSDQLPTGYGPGYDYLVRGVERAPGGGFYLRRTEAGLGPGGWGDALGEIPVRFSNNRFSLSIPLELLGPDDGRLDYSLELYSTVSSEDGSGEVSHVFVANYSGTAGPYPFVPLLGQEPLTFLADRR